MKQTTAAILFSALAWMLPVAPPAQAQDDRYYDAEDTGDYADEYSSGEYGRVLHRDNGLTLIRANRGDEPDGFGDDDRGADVNTPVYPGDTARTGPGQRAEIQLSGGILLRLDERTELVLLSLPNPYAEIQDTTVLQLVRGNLRVESEMRKEDDFRIDTPGSSVYLLGSGDFRIDVEGNGYTAVQSRSGVAEVVGDGGSVLVRSGNRTDVYPGSVPARASAFNTFARDRFDRWVEDRNNSYLAQDRYGDSREVYEELPYEVRPHGRELAAHGSWRRHSSYGWVWSPRAISADWRPYSAGYWDYGPGGYFWVSSEPWGWAPYRYGRWVYDDAWCWIPGRSFAGAWVSWSFGSVHLGWAPLNYYNRPVVVTNLVFGRYCPRSWNFVNYNHFGHRSYRNHYVRPHRLESDFRRGHIVARAPRIAPHRLARNVDSRREAVRFASGNRARQIDVSRENGKARNFRESERMAVRSPRGDRSVDRDTQRRGRSMQRARTSSGSTEVRTNSSVQTRDRAVRGGRNIRSDGNGRTERTDSVDRTDRSGRASRTPARTRTSERGVTQPQRDRQAPRERARPQAQRRTGTEDRQAPTQRTRPQVQRRTDSEDREAPRQRTRPQTQRRSESEERGSKAGRVDDRRSIYQRMAGPRSSRGDSSSANRDRRTRESRPQAERPRSSGRSSGDSDARDRSRTPQKRPEARQQPRSTPKASPRPKEKQPTRSSGSSQRPTSRSSASRPSRSSSPKPRASKSGSSKSSSSKSRRGAQRRNAPGA